MSHDEGFPYPGCADRGMEDCVARVCPHIVTRGGVKCCEYSLWNPRRPMYQRTDKPDTSYRWLKPSKKE